MKQIAIIGGGAAGLAAAITAAYQLRIMNRKESERAGDVQVVVYEKDDRVGRSILATGNGRCNFSNALPDPSLFRNGDFVGSSFDALREQCGKADEGQGAAFALGGDPVLGFFRALGLEWREESEGRLYPMANKATSVLDVLRAAASALGVHERCECQAVRIDEPEHSEERFHIRFADGSVQHADVVIVATGGKPGARMLPDSVPLHELKPVLGPLAVRGGETKALDNIRVRAAVALPCHGVRETGEILFRKYGVSGIAVFNLSRFAQPGDVLRIDLMPNESERECESNLYIRRKRLSGLLGQSSLTGEAFFQGMLLPQVARLVLQRAGVNPSQRLEKGRIPSLAKVLKQLDFIVDGLGDAKQCQVHRGGVDVTAVDPCTMQLCDTPGLHVAGEALDVDAPCGGFNLHWAWASGMLAGKSAVGFVMGE